MDCCSHVVTRRTWMWGTALASVGAMLGGCATHGGGAGAAAAASGEDTGPALAVLRRSISVDVHTHGGTTGIT